MNACIYFFLLLVLSISRLVCCNLISLFRMNIYFVTFQLGNLYNVGRMRNLFLLLLFYTDMLCYVICMTCKKKGMKVIVKDLHSSITHLFMLCCFFIFWKGFQFTWRNKKKIIIFSISPRFGALNIFLFKLFNESVINVS